MPIEKLHNTTANYLRICVSHVRSALHDIGWDLDALLVNAGLVDSGEAFPEAQITWSRYKSVLDHLEATGTLPGVGMIVGAKTQLGDLGMLGYASQSSRTFWDGLNVCVPFANQLGWNIRIRHTKNVQGKSELRVLTGADSDPSKAMLEQWLMVCLTGVERLMPASFAIDYSLLDFYFPYPQPAQVAHYRELFRGSRLHFDSDFCGWRYPVQWNLIELTTRDDIVSSFCARELALQQAPRIPKGEISSRVRCFIYASGEGSFPTMVDTAQHLNMSVATLRRKLKDAGVTFESLVEEMRKEMATTLIAKSDVTGEELAYQLGYRHSSNFYAAFKSWFGCSPKEYRKAHMQQALG